MLCRPKSGREEPNAPVEHVHIGPDRTLHQAWQGFRGISKMSLRGAHCCRRSGRLSGIGRVSGTTEAHTPVTNNRSVCCRAGSCAPRAADRRTRAGSPIRSRRAGHPHLGDAGGRAGDGRQPDPVRRALTSPLIRAARRRRDRSGGRSARPVAPACLPAPSRGGRRRCPRQPPGSPRRPRGS